MVKRFTLIKFLLGFFLAIISIFNSSAQIKINEICPSNVSAIINNNGKYDDWLELYNAGSSSASIEGYGLTDDSTNKFHFTFPSYTLAAGEKLVVFASDKASQQIVHHWEEAVWPSIPWKYKIGSATLDTNWRNPGFNDASWSTGNAGIGFEDGDDATIIPICISVMMRKTFTIPDTSQIMKGTFHMDYDDGFVAYLNGVEIARSNLGSVDIRPLWNELAPSSHEPLVTRGLPRDSFYLSSEFLKSIIKPGANVLTVEVHNVTSNSDDMSAIPYLFFGMKAPGMTFHSLPSWFIPPVKDYFNTNFKLSHSGETVFLYNPSGVEVDKKTYSSLDIDHVTCRIPDGSSNWCFSKTPTPGTSNNSVTCYAGYASAPIFSKQGGYYSSTQTLTMISSMPGGTIRYTTNGDMPCSSSKVYSSPITISSTVSIRARIFASGYLDGPAITNTYIINGTTQLPTFCITTDSLNLWDYNTGIYVMGPDAASTSPYKGANFWQDWSKPATIEYYDKSKNLIQRFDAEISIYGNYSRAKPQKSFEIKLKDKYGSGSINYALIPDKSFINNYSTIILRNSGTDWNKVHFRDAFMERIMKNTYSGYLATEPTIAYLNGEYWGVYHINEDHGTDWMKDNFGFDKSEVDYLKESGGNIKIQAGTDASFWDLYNYAITATPTTQQFYEGMDSKLDLKSCTDYFICETFYNNGDWIGDWTNNIQLWRPKESGGKWRYFLYDLDFGLGLNGSVNENRLAIARNPASFSFTSDIFDAILKNPTYKTYFINRYADLMNTIYLPANASAIMHSYKDSMAYDMTEHFAKWGNSTSTWNSTINSMMSFESNRLAIMKTNIKNEFGLQGIVAMTLIVSPANAGRIEISTVTPTTYPWTGDYFNGNPVTITAIPNPGYSFDHWRSTHVINTNNPNQSVTYNFNQSDQVTAFFTGSAEQPKICVSEFNYNSNSLYDAGDWIELHNYGTTSIDISGWTLRDGNDNHKYKFPTGTTIAANNYLVIVEDSIKFKSIYPAVNNYIGITGFNFSNSADQVRLFDYQEQAYLYFYYQDEAPWPVLPDGEGYTCELTNNIANPNDPNSWFPGCFGGSPGQAYSTNLNLPVSISGSSVCNGSGFMKATYFPGSVYQWMENGSNISGANDSVYNANLAGSYSVEINNNGCTATSPSLVITNVNQLPLPNTVGATRCGAGAIILSANATDTVFWYDAAHNGNLVGIGNNLQIPYQAQTQTYYARNGRFCPSDPVATVAEILVPTAVPISNDAIICGPGVVTLTASDTADIHWYNYASGGGLLGTGSSFTTNYLNNDTSFFVEAGNVCPSQRIEVNVIVEASEVPMVTDGNRCGNGSVALSATSTVPVLWFNSPSGGSQMGTGNSFNTPYLYVTDTFYAEANNGCPSPRIMCIAMVNLIPPSPSVRDTTICGPASVTLQAVSSEQVHWYNVASGGQSIFLGSNFTTPSLSSTTTYYASAGYTCESNRRSVKVTVNLAPSPPNASNVTRCDQGTVTLTASSNQTIYWYDVASGGSSIATGPVYTTPVLSSTKNYYVEAGNYCRSQRSQVSAIIENRPGTPTLFDTIACGTGSTAIIRAASPTQVNWYAQPSGGSSIGTGLTFTTPPLSTTTTYYADAGFGTCNSNRVGVAVAVLSIPSSPTVTDNYRCSSGTVDLHASHSQQLFWYSTPTSSNLLATGSTFTTPNLSVTTTYYVEAGNICKSQRVPVKAMIKNSQLSNVTGGFKCGPGAVALTATSTVSADSIKWYDTPGGNAICTGGILTTPYISQTTTYYVTGSAFCLNTPMTSVAMINPVPVISNWIDTINLLTGQTAMLNAGSGFVNYSWSTGASTPQIQVSVPGVYSVVVTNSSGCTKSEKVVVNFITSINHPGETESFSIYPNPAKENIYLSISNFQSKKLTFKLISTDGKILRNEEIKTTGGLVEKEISLIGVASGIYYLNVESESLTKATKIVVE